jgi:iron(III) transport system substrate-binding protein
LLKAGNLDKDQEKGVLMMSHLFRLCLIAIATMISTGARAADAALIEAAKKEGKVVWYTTLLMNQLGGPLANAFEKKYGIKVEASRNDPGETMLRLMQENRADNMQADVFDGSLAPDALVREGAIMKFQASFVANWPKELYDPNGYWTAHRLTVVTPGVNTSLIPPGSEPKTWDDLLDPKWKNGIAWGINPGITGATGFIGLVLAERGEERGLAFLRQLARQNITGLKMSARAVLDQVIAGEYPMALGILNDNVVISRKVGAPVAWIPMTPALASVSVISVMAKAKHPNAGKLLAEFVVSDEGQAIARDHDYIPVHPDVAPSDPTLRPDGIRFRARTMSPTQVEEAVPRWKKVFDDIFR